MRARGAAIGVESAFGDKPVPAVRTGLTSGRLRSVRSESDPARAPLWRLLFGNRPCARVATGRCLFRQGDPSECVVGLLSGTVETTVCSTRGETFTVNLQTGPDIVGEIGALDGRARTATATCRSNCVIATLPRDLLLRRIEAHPGVAHAMLMRACGRARWVTELLADRTFLDIRTRLAKRLLLLDRLLADAAGGWIAISQSGIAESLGASRESVNKLLGDWKALSLVDLRRGRIRVADPGRLRWIAARGGVP